jgi:hypothetical protein
MQVANAKVIATPERSATNADLAVFYEDVTRSNGRNMPPGRPFDVHFTLPRARPPRLVVSAAAMAAATEASAVTAATEPTAAKATTTKSATAEPA